MPDTPHDPTLEARIERVLTLLEPLPGQITNLYDRLGKTREESIKKFATIEGSLREVARDIESIKASKYDFKIHDVERRAEALSKSVGRLHTEMNRRLPSSAESSAQLQQVHDLARDAERAGKWRERWIALVFVVLAAVITSIVMSWLSGRGGTPPEPKEKRSAPHTTR